MLVILEGLAPRLGFLAAGVELLLGAEAVIGMTTSDELLGIGHIELLAFGLDIGTDIAADIGTLIPVHAAAAQGIIDDLGSTFHKALLVGILDAQNEFSTHLFCVQIII